MINAKIFAVKQKEVEQDNIYIHYTLAKPRIKFKD